MFNALREAWKNETSRSVDYGVFESRRGTVLVQAPLVEEMPKTQLAQYRQWYFRSFPWGEWHGTGFLPSDETRLVNAGLNVHNVREAGVEKFRRYYY